MAILNNLYPPIVDTYAPAFINTESCRLYFSISLFNTVREIKNVQVSIRDQNTNISVLNEKKYPCGVMVTNLHEDFKRTTDDKYYVTIKDTDMIDGKFELNTYYKVQLRFTSTEAGDYTLSDPSIQAIDSWLVKYLNCFSEWSTVCLIRGISTPNLKIPGLDTTSDYSVWTVENVDIVGQLTFADPAETEVLKSYNIKLYNDKDTLLLESGTIYSNNYVGINQINYTLKYGLLDGETYKLVVDYVTNDLYEGSKTFNFLVVLGAFGTLDATLSSIEDIENGRIGINIKSNTVEKFTGNITIRRTSSESNFTIWEDVYTLSIENEILNYTWYDYTVKSGTWYRYCAQKRDSLGNRGVITNLKNPVMIMFEHMFLTAEGTQICIKYDPQVSSFKRTVMESKTDTIGSQYPFVKRNGYTYYREFPISGLITQYMDETHILTSREELYKDTLELYDDYNDKHRITLVNDSVYERDFREIVMEFLYKNNVKLFRSTTEGNILVKLMNISFTPNQVLGRHIYSFNCTAYEIADFTTENCNKYNIQPLGAINNELSYSETYNMQVNDTLVAGRDLFNLLQEEKYQKNNRPGYITKVQSLDFLRLELENEPYLIGEDGSGPYPIVDGRFSRSVEELEKAYLGYIVYINKIPIVINPEGIYELKGEGVEIVSLSFPVDTQINIMAHVTVTQTENKSQLPTVTNYFRKVGQYWGSFEYKDSLYKKLWDKYYEKYTSHIQQLTLIDGIRIEANPGTVVYVKEVRERDYDRHVIGETCLLSFTDPNSVIEGIYFAGIHFEEGTEYELDRKVLPDFRYKDTGIEIKSFDEVKNPIRNGVYTLIEEGEDTSSIEDGKYKEAINEELSSNKYIWYNGKWYPFTESHDLLCPVEAMIDYYCEIMKGMFSK